VLTELAVRPNVCSLRTYSTEGSLGVDASVGVLPTSLTLHTDLAHNVPSFKPSTGIEPVPRPYQGRMLPLSLARQDGIRTAEAMEGPSGVK
jgi:hypothetical protein